MEISIIVPIYNTPANLLKQCLESLRQAIYSVPKGVMECLVIDDGSTMEHVEAMMREIEDGVIFRFVRKENGGVSTARNLGIDMAKGDYLMFVDSDDWLEYDAFTTALRIIHQEPADIICLGYYDDEFEKERVISYHEVIEGDIRIKEYISEMTNRKAEAIKHNINLYSPWAKLYRRKIIEDYHLRFDDELKVAQDFWLNICFMAQCNKIVLDNRQIYHYVTNAGSLIHKFSDIRLQEGITFLNRLEYFLHKQMGDDERFKKAIRYQLLMTIGGAMTSYFLHPDNKDFFGEKKRKLSSYLHEPTISRWSKELCWKDGQNHLEMRDILLLKCHLYWIRLLIVPIKRKAKYYFKKR